MGLFLIPTPGSQFCRFAPSKSSVPVTQAPEELLGLLAVSLAYSSTSLLSSVYIFQAYAN